MNRKEIQEKAISDMETKYSFKFKENKFYISLLFFFQKNGFLTEKQIKAAKTPLVIDTSLGFQSDLDREYQMAH